MTKSKTMKNFADGAYCDIPIEDRATPMTDQEALKKVIALAEWAVNRLTMTSEEYSEANMAISRMEDITLEG